MVVLFLVINTILLICSFILNTYLFNRISLLEKQNKFIKVSEKEEADDKNNNEEDVVGSVFNIIDDILDGKTSI